MNCRITAINHFEKVYKREKEREGLIERNGVTDRVRERGERERERRERERERETKI
jgi:hypothetical protein